jgi:hypothetical protein
MSPCLALLLTAIAINWWNGWKPFTHPFQMPGYPWLKQPPTIHSKRWRSTPCPRPIVDAREPPSTLLDGSRPQPAMRLQGRVRVHRSSASHSCCKGVVR